MLFTFCHTTNGPNSQNTPDAQDVWSENKIFHNSLCVLITISTLLQLPHLLSLHKSLVYLPFIYVFCERGCSEDVRNKPNVRSKKTSHCIWSHVRLNFNYFVLLYYLVLFVLLNLWWIPPVNSQGLFSNRR